MGDNNRKYPWTTAFVGKEKVNVPVPPLTEQKEIIDKNEPALADEAKNDRESWGESIKPENPTVENDQVTEALAIEEIEKENMGISEQASEEEVESKQKILAEAIKLHDLGVAGDKKAVVEAHKLLQQFLEQEPENVEAKGYLGSIISLIGRDAISPMERMNKALEGLKILDQVVKSNPENTQVRILRANVSYRLPEMYFHRTDTAVEDFKYLISRYEKDPSIFTEDFYWKLLYDLGGAYKNLNRQEEAKKTWLKLLEVTKDEKYVKLLKQEGIRKPKKDKKDKKTEKVDNIPELPVTKEVDLVVKPPEEESLSSEDIVKLEEPIASHEAEDTSYEEKETSYEDEDTSEDEEEISNPETKESFKEAIKLYLAARAGDKEATSKAFAYFNKATRDNPDDDLITAYYADCLSMTGRDSKVSTAMFMNAIKATKLLDKVVNNNPENIEIRLIRAYQSFRLPESFFRRTATAIADFEYIIRRYEENDQVLDRDTYWQVLYDLGVCYKRLELDEQALEVWDKLLAQTPYDKYHDLIEKQLGTDLGDIDSKIASLQNKKELLEEGIRLHDIGVAGHKVAVQKAHDILKKAHEMDPNDPIALGYYASSIALLARDANEPNTIFGNTIQAIKMLKKAVSKDNTNPELHLLRGYLYAALPETFFPFGDKAAKDLKFVKNAFEQGNSKISEELYWRVLYDLGALYKRTGDYRRTEKVWKRLLEVSRDPSYRTLVDIDIEE